MLAVKREGSWSFGVASCSPSWAGSQRNRWSLDKHICWLAVQLCLGLPAALSAASLGRACVVGSHHPVLAGGSSTAEQVKLEMRRQEDTLAFCMLTPSMHCRQGLLPVLGTVPKAMLGQHSLLATQLHPQPPAVLFSLACLLPSP